MQQEKKVETVPMPKGNSEATALADIVEWSKSCPVWQRDALRRLGLQDTLASRASRQ